MNGNLRVDDMAAEVLTRQARTRAESTSEPYEAALAAVLETEAGRQLEELRVGRHGGDWVQRWQEDLPRERAGERVRLRQDALGRTRETQRSLWTGKKNYRPRPRINP